jgi:poly-gamma-glutamate system protein
MKKIYWRPRAVSRPALLLIALISLSGLSVVERWKVQNAQPFFEEKRAAAKLAQDAFEVVKKARVESGVPIDPTIDPSESGLVGLPMSPVTTVSGEVSAKQTSANPNFAAVIVDMLKEAKVQEGDVVAVGCSGSFPALNICTYAACETLKVKPLVISSSSASQWGANVPQLLWPDMERLLRQKRTDSAGGELPPVFNIKSIACSIGGYQDRGLGLSEEGLKLVISSIERNGLTPFRVEAPADVDPEEALANMQEDFIANVEERMKFYEDAAEGKPIRAYINVGGGTVSVGRNIGKLMFKPGLNKRPPRHIRDIDGVMPRFINMGVPVLHVVHINALADRYSLPLEPAVQPSIGTGGVFYGIDYSKPLVVGVLAFILLSLYGFIRSDVGFRLLRASQRARKDSPPEPMV